MSDVIAIYRQIVAREKDDAAFPTERVLAASSRRDLLSYLESHPSWVATPVEIYDRTTKQRRATIALSALPHDPNSSARVAVIADGAFPASVELVSARRLKRVAHAPHSAHQLLAQAEQFVTEVHTRMTETAARHPRATHDDVVRTVANSFRINPALHRLVLSLHDAAVRFGIEYRATQREHRTGEFSALPPELWLSEALHGGSMAHSPIRPGTVSLDGAMTLSR